MTTDSATPGPSAPPLVVVISGPSGVGKDSVLASLRKRGYRFHFTVTATTRSPRAGERDGEDYHFVSSQTFQEMLTQGEFLEHAQVYGHRYGVPKEEIRKGLARGEDVFLRVDVQGVATIRQLLPEAVFVFLAPASAQELKVRLSEDTSEREGTLELRRARYEEEMEELANFDYLVTNPQGRLDQAVNRILAIVTAEKCRVAPRRVEL